jgi:hypothetical protein
VQLLMLAEEKGVSVWLLSRYFLMLLSEIFCYLLMLKDLKVTISILPWLSTTKIKAENIFLSNLSTISWQLCERITFWWNNDDICFVQDQHIKFGFYSDQHTELDVLTHYLDSEPTCITNFNIFIYFYDYGNIVA